VVRGTGKALVVGDMPFMTYHVSVEQALTNAARFIQEAGTQAVKLEGGVTVADKVKRIVDCGIPVMGHIGLTPQSINQFGGHKIQGKTPEVARKMLDDAIALEQAGVFAVVLETVPAALATFITKKLSVPTIGIGAGIGCDGQVQVVNDILGSYTGYIPKHAKQYAKLVDVMSNAFSQYLEEVTSGKFPTEANSFPMDETILDTLE
jgi:3-methyl-2-oxobutanoate hydroxymethyltransferase